jgi:DNA-binding transcriptional MerR regulator
MDEETERVFTVAEAAKARRVSEWTIRYWLRRGQLRCLQRCRKGAIRITAADLFEKTDSRSAAEKTGSAG